MGISRDSRNFSGRRAVIFAIAGLSCSVRLGIVIRVRVFADVYYGIIIMLSSCMGMDCSRKLRSYHHQSHRDAHLNITFIMILTAPTDFDASYDCTTDRSYAGLNSLLTLTLTCARPKKCGF